MGILLYVKLTQCKALTMLQVLVLKPRVYPVITFFNIIIIIKDTSVQLWSCVHNSETVAHTQLWPVFKGLGLA